MAKDPAFLFYTSDFLTGTMFMTNEQVGIYLRLLCSQHQHGGIIDKITFNSLVNNHDIIKVKFIECEAGFYNERLAAEMLKREKTSTNISKAAKETWIKRKNTIVKENDTIVLQSHNDTNTKLKENDTILIRPEDENEIKNINNKIPDFETFLSYAKSREPLVSEKGVRDKYDAWVEAGWKNGNGAKITRWKSNLINTLPHIPKDTEKIIPTRRALT